MKCLEVFLLMCSCGMSAAHMNLVIHPLGRTISMRRNEDLNLICMVSDEENTNKTFEISWILPIQETDIRSRVRYNKTANVLELSVSAMQKTDSGQYICEARYGENIQRQKISVVVNTDRDKCSHLFFDCGRPLCIPLQYVCDGYQDCPDGSDESFEHCGLDACEGKIFCDGRCILKKFCCDHRLDANCTNLYINPCCQRYIIGVHSADILGMDTSDIPVTYKYHNLGFYQSTIYTMISCAIAFIFMSTIMLIAVCRIRMRRNAWFLQSSGQSSHRLRRWRRPTSRGEQSRTSVHAGTETTTAAAAPSYNSQQDNSDPMENFVLLTYDSNTGFEVAEYGPKPPPYAENNVGIPPPPYSSTVDIPAELNAERDHCSPPPPINEP